ncbi:MAG: XrtA/PEP-CTERM system-associated ATPase [Desulfuromonadales bacterium]|uniref:XrtA/PEP-CTERM system-associated ATPase n=1 Tax=Desulfuromonas sp. KJ2020 TaxID=2919173 RepID=UPI0020A7E38D|nr:XrtA/PEP-CTERM system-associated ATPase [Desulfuromonas sp. KJ2020]MCP3178154.1 XrtA-associated ATPase [Desulfuromonas sp. KJ2020]
MYNEFFGFTLKPFEIVPNPQFLYPSDPHRKALSYLEYGLKEGAGFILLTGEVGSGKTTILKDIISRFSGHTSLAMVFNTRVDSLQLIAMVNEEFGLNPEGKDKVALLRELNSYLIEEYANHGKPILIIDEAQNLSLDTLEEIRLLSNLEAENTKLLQIVLAGQPELKTLIAKPELRQLKQRINIGCHLRPLRREETEDYILYRMEKAGNREAVTFEAGAMDLIYRFSSGIPRLINVLCDFILLAAFADQVRDVTLDMVREVIDDLDILGESEALEEVEVVDEDSLLHQKENLLERISMHENILKVLMAKQREEFTRLSNQLDTLSAQMAEVKTIAESLRFSASHDEELRSGKKKLFNRSLGWS